MQLAVIVTVLLRIIALKLAFDSLFQFLITCGPFVRGGEPQWWSIIPIVVAFVGVLAACALLWAYSEPLSTRIAGGHTRPLTIAPLTLEDLYSVCMVFIGLQCVSAAIPPLMTNAHAFLSYTNAPGQDTSQRDQLFYNLAYYVIMATVGGGLIFGARKFGLGLAAKHRKTQGTPNHAVERTAK